MAEGRSNQGIATRLIVTEHAVEKHVRNIFQKLGITVDAEAMQLEFWTELATLLTTRGLRAPAPSTRSHCYVGIGTSLGKLVLTAPTAEGGVGCKLALSRSKRGGVEAARAMHQRLESERLAIEQELGFHDLDWGSRESDTRVYRYRSCDISARSEWPAAQAWLAQTAAAFACVFGQRLRSFGEQRGAEEPVRRSLRSGRDLRAQGGNRDAETGPTDINGRTARRRTSVGARDIGSGRWVDERLRRLARDPELELRTGSFPNGDRWCGVYSAEEPESAYRYAFGQWWGEPSLSSSVAWILLNPATGDTDGRARPVRSYCRNRSREWGFTGFVIVNLFAYRHRDRTRLQETSAVGPFNDEALEIVTSACPRTLAALGRRRRQLGARARRSSSASGRALLPAQGWPDAHGRRSAVLSARIANHCNPGLAPAWRVNASEVPRLRDRAVCSGCSPGGRRSARYLHPSWSAPGRAPAPCRLISLLTEERVWLGRAPSSLHVATCATRRAVDPSYATAVGLKALLSIHRVYALPLVAGRTRSPASIARQVSSPKSAQTSCSPIARIS